MTMKAQESIIACSQFLTKSFRVFGMVISSIAWGRLVFELKAAPEEQFPAQCSKHSLGPKN